MKMLAICARVIAVVLFGALSGCSEKAGNPVIPIVPPPKNPDTPTPPVVSGSPPAFPAVPSTSTAYVGPPRLYDFFIAVHGSSLPTRYVLNPDSTFVMQFASYSYGIFSYTGRYVREGAKLTFSWDGSYSGAPWSATGTLRGDTLGISYNINMQMSDFIDGAYVLAR